MSSPSTYIERILIVICALPEQYGSGGIPPDPDGDGEHRQRTDDDQDGGEDDIDAALEDGCVEEAPGIDVRDGREGAGPGVLGDAIGDEGEFGGRRAPGIAERTIDCRYRPARDCRMRVNRYQRRARGEGIAPSCTDSRVGPITPVIGCE
jgi:hypothetical protein